jgi:hypothetical protein
MEARLKRTRTAKFGHDTRDQRQVCFLKSSRPFSTRLEFVYSWVFHAKFLIELTSQNLIGRLTKALQMSKTIPGIK